MPKVLPEYLELRRQQILDAAAVCFSRRGFHQTTMQDICREVELSPGAVYRYFPSKDAIIEGMCNRGQEQNAEALSQGLAAGGTWAALDELIRIFFVEMDDLKSLETCSLNVELIAESPRNERVQALQARNIQDVRERLTRFMKHAQANGEIDPDLDPEAIARVMIAQYQGLVTQRLVEPNLDVTGYADVLRALYGGTFWRGSGRKPSDNGSADAPARPAESSSALLH
jgi:TetR/AcrR family transcriptional repressor of uid operon